MLSEAGLRSDLQAAMKARSMPTVYVLRGLLTAAANLRIEKQVAELAESDLVALVQREAKKRDEAAAFARDAGRTELAEQNAAERAILDRYLPRQIGEEELRALLQTWIGEGVNAIGPLMARLKERHAGCYDGKQASALARELLAAR
jgi:uncharacterized protein YqeY